MYFDRFDICEAYYVFASLHHGGQWSKTYRIFGRLESIGFRPRRSISKDSLTDNGQEILAGLVERDA